MNLKMEFVLLLFCLTMASAAQDRSYVFSHVQTRNIGRQWEPVDNIGQRLAHFSSSGIEVKIDREYWLTIIKKTQLPQRGMVYLCRDQYQKPVTVTVFDNDKMLLYSDNHRFRIVFERLPKMAPLKDSYVDAD